MDSTMIQELVRLAGAHDQGVAGTSALYNPTPLQHCTARSTMRPPTHTPSSPQGCSPACTQSARGGPRAQSGAACTPAARLPGPAGLQNYCAGWGGGGFITLGQVCTPNRRGWQQGGKGSMCATPAPAVGRGRAIDCVMDRAMRCRAPMTDQPSGQVVAQRAMRDERASDEQNP